LVGLSAPAIRVSDCINPSVFMWAPRWPAFCCALPPCPFVPFAAFPAAALARPSHPFA